MGIRPRGFGTSGVRHARGRIAADFICPQAASLTDRSGLMQNPLIGAHALTLQPAQTLHDLPLWRSLLFVPVTVERFVAKAPTVGADGLQLDLEDSIAPSEKERARALLPAVAGRYAEAGHDVVVRINSPWSLAVPDMQA